MEKTEAKISTLKINSTEFKDHGAIPSKYTYDGQNINPSLGIENLPKEAVSIVIIMDDPDSKIKTWVHWIMWNIKPTITIKEGINQGIQGVNDFKQNRYDGPCPPSGSHRYFFKIYALDSFLDLAGNSSKEDLLEAMQGHIIAAGELVGVYKKE